VLLPDNIRTNARHHRVFPPKLFDTIEDGMRDIIRIQPSMIEDIDRMEGSEPDRR